MLDYDFHITTLRLFIPHLNPANDAHCDFMYELILSLGIAKEMPAADAEKAKSIPARDAGRKFIVDCVEKVEKTGYGRYLVSLRRASALDINSSHQDIKVPFSQRRPTPIGVVSMQHARFPFTPSAPTIPDVGFGILSRYFGNGYTTEAAVGSNGVL